MTPEELAHARHMIEHTAYTGPIVGSRLIAHIDEQAAQIDALKGLLIEERANNIQNNPNSTIEVLWCRALDIAREQLVAKYPEAMK